MRVIILEIKSMCPLCANAMEINSRTPRICYDKCPTDISET